MADPWKIFVADLISGDEERRTRAFKQLRPMLIEETIDLPSDVSLVRKLRQVMLESDDEDEFKVLQQILTWINTTSLISLANVGPPETDPKKVVSEWFWEPVLSTSIAFRAWEQDRRRDEDAMIDWLRFLSRDRFRNVRIQRVTLDSFDWGKALPTDLSAVVFLGRLGMYGDTATKYFSRDNWFRFLSDERPEYLGLNEFDPRYHRIIAGDEQDEDPPRYVTHEENGKRTDYGLVQRYVVKYNVGKIVVIGLWGCSTLGTLAAVKWAIDLERNNDPPPIMPLDIDTPLEALIKVQADTCNYNYTWDPEPIQLEELHIGSERWDPRTRSWGLRPSLTLEWESLTEKSGRIINYEKTTKTSGLIARIINVLAKKKLPPGKVVDLSEILSQSELDQWRKQRTTTGKRIREYTGGCIEPEGKECLRIHALITTRKKDG